MAELTTGVPALDELIDGVRVGDNLVILGPDTTTLEAVGRAFVAAVADGPTVVVRTEDRAAPPPPDVVLLDWREGSATTMPAADGPAGVATDGPAGVAAGVAAFRAALATLDAADAGAGEGASFLIDSLTGIQDRWGADLALETFLSSCPRLYRRGSVAMWLLVRDRHDRAFLDRLCEITQVVIDVRRTDGQFAAEVLVAAGRPGPTVGRRVALESTAGGLEAAGPVSAGRQRLGTLVRAQRTTRGLSQAELARRIGISPSALSQVERGVRGLSAESLIRIWEVLGVPFGPEDPSPRGYRIDRRAGHQRRDLAEGVRGHQRLDDPRVGQLWEVRVAPGARGRHPLFPGKATEVVLVRRGALDVEVGGHHETLHEGDTLLAPDAVIRAWANPTTEPVELVWSLLR
jgi:transcriptional regulator with XRE-family HTH domain